MPKVVLSEPEAWKDVSHQDPTLHHNAVLHLTNVDNALSEFVLRPCQVSTVELWLLKPPDEEEFPSDRRAGPGSVLDQHVEDKAILAAVGYAMHSDGLRRGGGPRPEDEL